VIKKCKKCEIILCKKNEYVQYDKKLLKYYIAHSCKSCVANANFCSITYPTEELEELSKKQCQNISKRKWRLKNNEKVKEFKTIQKQKQKSSVAELDNDYVKLLLTRLANHHFTLDNISEEQILLKKKELIIKRNLKNQGIWVR
jgi:hypothetical protein